MEVKKGSELNSLMSSSTHLLKELIILIVEWVGERVEELSKSVRKNNNNKLLKKWRETGTL